MKGTILNCLHELVKIKAGESKWNEILKNSAVPPNFTFTISSDIEDAIVMRIIASTCKALSISLEQAGEIFGDYWVNVYAPKVYVAYFVGMKSAKDFLLRMEKVHAMATKEFANAQPPKFEMKILGQNQLQMKYISKRRLFPVFVGLVKGVAKYFQEEIKLEITAAETILITFKGKIVN